MMNREVQPVILSGGSGTRLWPMSRAGFPKQFLSLADQPSSFQQTVTRLLEVKKAQFSLCDPIIVTGEDQRFFVVDQLDSCNISNKKLILESEGKNTAASLTLAALSLVEVGKDPILAVAPADHRIDDVDAFGRAINVAIQNVDDLGLMVFGVRPHNAATGFGYICFDKTKKSLVYDVLDFVEKPDESTALKFLQLGSYYWNSGMFLMHASTWLESINHFRPDIYFAVKKAWDSRSEERQGQSIFLRPNPKALADVPSESIDYAVMMKCPGSKFRLKMTKLDAGWSDLGSWEAVAANFPSDEFNNAFHGDVISTNSQNSFVYGSERLIALVGVKDLTIIDTPDAIMVAATSQSQEVKEIVNKLRVAGRYERNLHRKVYRPWGWYDVLEEGPSFKVKRIRVNPGARLSLQKHLHRTEHWVVVSGVAEVTNGEEVLTLKESESTYIPREAKHRLSNPSEVPLDIIEVQTGDYLEEDDIIRFEDVYGRVEK